VRKRAELGWRWSAILLAAIAGIAFAVLRRRRGGTMADAGEAVRRLLEGVWDDLGVVDEVVADDYVGHNPALPEPIRGRRG
jgi:hypothetical protein